MPSVLQMLEYMSKSKISPTFAYVISKQLVLFCFVFFASFSEIVEILPEETKVTKYKLNTSAMSFCDVLYGNSTQYLYLIST